MKSGNAIIQFSIHTNLATRRRTEVYEGQNIMLRRMKNVGGKKRTLRNPKSLPFLVTSVTTQPVCDIDIKQVISRQRGCSTMSYVNTSWLQTSASWTLRFEW